MGDLLGKGFFAEVRKGEWRGCKVAVKIIYRESFKNKNDIELFYQEAEILRYMTYSSI
jgi:serine/threonine protein kinase